MSAEGARSSRESQSSIAAFAIVALLVLVAGCSRTEDEIILPWCKYRTVRGPGGGGIFGGSSHNEVLVRRWYGWSAAFDENAGPGRPIVLTQSAVLVPMAGTARILTPSASPTPLACGNEKAAVSVPPKGAVVDCVDHLAGPAAVIATSLRVRRLDPEGKLISAHEFTAGGPGRVFLTPSVQFYDDEGTPYLVTFRDPWATNGSGGFPRSSQATPERLQQIACELIAVGQNPTLTIAAPPGHTVVDCSTPEVWSRVLGRPLRAPWKS